MPADWRGNDGCSLPGMDVGFTLKPDHDIERFIALTRQAEAAGFTHGWLFDNHLPFREVYPLLTLMALNTTRMRLGTCVTNPATRDPSVTASALATLDEISGGRMDLGIGRGDSSVRALGQPPTSMKVLEQAVTLIRDLVEGRTTEREGAALSLPWTGAWKLPTWIAGYGPMALALTGRIADGLILQLADPDLVRWMVGQMHASAEQAGRDPASIQVQAAAPAHVGAIEASRDHVRWFPAAVMGHITELVNRYPSDELPASLTGYVRDRAGDEERSRSEFGTANAASVTDDVVDRLAIVGPPEEHVRRLTELSEAGVDQFNLYLMNGDEEAQLEAYGSTVIPALKAALAEA
jgi:probable F420-dependent oxidoreductase